jgi:hypothetical protein
MQLNYMRPEDVKADGVTLYKSYNSGRVYRFHRIDGAVVIELIKGCTNDPMKVGDFWEWLGGELDLTEVK